VVGIIVCEDHREGISLFGVVGVDLVISRRWYLESQLVLVQPLLEKGILFLRLFYLASNIFF